MSAIPHPAIDTYARHVNPQFIKLLALLGYGRVFTRACDVWVWDDQGRRYLDCLAGFGSVNIGHNHPRLLARLQEFLAEQALQFAHVGPGIQAAELAVQLAGILPELAIVLFASGGAEAVEAGMKLARAATHRSGFLYCQGGFHGTSLGTLPLMGKERMRSPFEPLLTGCRAVAFGDLTQLEQELAARRVAGFVLEPVLAEGGVVLPPDGYLRAVRELCQRYGTLLILDEIQTGLGRTGTMLACQAEGVVPDILVLAKALSGGIAPISATLTTRAIHDRAYGSLERFDLHSSTFGGNAFSCVAAGATLRILSEEDLVGNSLARGRQLLDGVRQRLAGHPLVRAVRGRGLLIGIELGATDCGWFNLLAPGLVDLVSEKIFGQWVALKLLEAGIICQPAAHCWNVLKLEPPLTIQAPEIEQVIATVGDVIEQYRDIAAVLKDATWRIITGSAAAEGFR